MPSEQIQTLVPMVIENSGRSERAFDIFSLLLKENIIFLGTGINDQVANLIVAQMLYLQQKDPEKPINVTFTQLGGETVTAEGALPLHHSVVAGDDEFRFTALPGARGFLTVTADRCDYP